MLSAKMAAILSCGRCMSHQTLACLATTTTEWQSSHYDALTLSPSKSNVKILLYEPKI